MGINILKSRALLLLIKAKKIFALIIISVLLLSTACKGPISLETAPTSPSSFQEKPQDLLSLLPILEELKNSELQDPQLQQDIYEFSAALSILCWGERQVAEKRLWRLFEKTENTIVRNQLFFLLVQSYYYRGAWQEMQRLIEIQGERIENLYGDYIAELTKFSPESVSFPQQKTVMPLIIKSGLPLVNVSINGKPGIFLVDTGASKSMIYSSFARECGVRPFSFKDVRTPAFMIQYHTSEIAVIAELKIGQISITQHPALMMSSLLPSFTMPKIDGILGWNALRHLRMEIDLRKKTISFAQPIKEKGKNRNLFWLGYPIVYLRTLSGQDVYMKLDTGSRMTLFNDNLVKRSLIRTGHDKIRDPWGPVREPQGNYLFLGTRLDLVLDRYLLKFKTPLVNKQLHLSDLIRVDGLLGCDLLRLGAFVIDYQNGVFELVALNLT